LFCHYLIPLKYIYIILNIHIVFSDTFHPQGPCAEINW
jgi:hypothetical protein